MNKNFAIVVSEFNQEVTESLLNAALSRLIECSVSKEHIFVAKVPGAVEIPLIAKILAKTKKYDAIICLGAVIRGDTDHYRYVCDQVSQGCQQVMLEYEIPVVFGILTTESEEQALERAGGRFGNKGTYAADAALVMVNLLEEITFASL